MTSKYQVLFNGRLIALVFLTGDAPGIDGVLGGIIPVESSGTWSAGDSIHVSFRKLEREVLSRETAELEAVKQLLAGSAIEPEKCSIHRYE